MNRHPGAQRDRGARVQLACYRTQIFNPTFRSWIRFSGNPGTFFRSSTLPNGPFFSLYSTILRAPSVPMLDTFVSSSSDALLMSTSPSMLEVRDVDGRPARGGRARIGARCGRSAAAEDSARLGNITRPR